MSLQLESSQAESNAERLLGVLNQYWGYDRFLPLQQEAMECGLDGQDSLVVLPTGGGKSLCYQAPAMCRDGLTLVVSPLISLMKDQVDSLRACGIQADFSNSSQTPGERRDVARRVREGETKLLYLAPERLVNDSTIGFLQQTPLSMIAVDEAHCISAWGHDFRPEYRRLGLLKQTIPNVAIHAFTATATEQVRNDIVEQLGLDSPQVLVGSFDRPNLTYRVVRRTRRLEQVRRVIDRHPDESGIVYCISRSDVETVCKGLNDRGYRAAPYHAGFDDERRKRTQEAFSNDQVQTIVATIAFGMGIDKPDVRYVIHCGMPKSIENYQQETGRAGRDGLEAECVMFFSGNDFHVWKSMMESSEEGENALNSLSSMYQYCNGVSCRHQSLVRHFGQELGKDECEACDVCLGEIETIQEPLIIAQKIISCVARLGQRFGGDYTSLVLAGSTEQRILERGHNDLSTWGILADHDRREVRDWIEQLVEQNCLQKMGEYNVLEITESGAATLRGEHTPRLLVPPNRSSSGKTKKRGPSTESWEGVHRPLFDELRGFRKELAAQQGVPAYVVFGDQALRDMARIRPASTATFLLVRGVGAHKLEKYGESFTEFIRNYCEANQLELDVAAN